MLKKKKQIIFGALIFIIGAYVYYFLNTKYSFAINCPFHELTGLYCPGCGISRMIFSIMKLDFYQAFRFNPLIFIMLGLYLLIKFINIFFKKKKIIIGNKQSVILLIIVIMYGILRNIPIFDFLKPTLILK